MCAALHKIPGGTSISDIARDAVGVVLSTAVDLAPRSKLLHRAKGWCADPGGAAGMEGAWQQKEERRRCLHKMAGENRRKACESAMRSFFRTLVRKLENEFEKAIRSTSTST